VKYCGGHFENGDRQNFSMSGISSGHHYLPTYQILRISDNVEFLRYCGGSRHFQNGRHNTHTFNIVRFQRPELLPDIEQFLPVSIFKMATTIPQKFDFKGSFWFMWRPFWKWRLVEIFRCQESIWDIITYPHMKCRWNRTMLNLWSIVVAILKMATGRIFRLPFSKWLSKHGIKMAATIPQKFNIVWYHQNLTCG
jgi:hypothetical protein